MVILELGFVVKPPHAAGTPQDYHDDWGMPLNRERRDRVSLRFHQKDMHLSEHSEAVSSALQGSPFERASVSPETSAEASPATRTASLRDGRRRKRSATPWRDDPSPPATRPTPVPKRPKGRLFIGLLLFAACATLVYMVWDWQFRYHAHGVVHGRVLRVPSPWDGSVQALHVREGDQVRQGQLVATVENISLQQQLAKVADELKLAQAKLESQVSQLRWQSQLRGDRSQKALGEYYQAWGELLDERSRLMQFEADWKRLETTRTKHSLAVRKKDLETAKYRFQGQQAKVEKLEDAVSQLKRRVEIYEQFEDDASAQLRPNLLSIENLQAELKRLREIVQQGEVRSPVNGVVIKVHCYAGDSATASTPIMEIVEDQSLEPVLYVRQNSADAWRIGDEIEVRIDPGSQQVTCEITRLGNQMEFAPPNIARYYRKDERLLPVFLKPRRAHGVDLRLYLGAEVKLHRSWGWETASGAKTEAASRDSSSKARTDNIYERVPQ